MAIEKRLIGNRDVLAANLEAIALLHLLLPVSIVFVAVLGFAFGLGLSAWNLLIATIITVSVIRFLSASWRVTALAVAVALITHVAAYWISLTIFDSSYDGLFYHQEAVIRLGEGWNPLYQEAPQFVEFYPKASWIAGAVVFIAGGEIEAGKLFQFTLIAAAFCQLAALLLRFTSLRFFTIGTIAFLGAANPVAVYQSTTYLNDGLIASTLTVLLAAMTNYVCSLRWQQMVTAVVASALLINLKFTGLAYVLLLLNFSWVIIWLRHGFRAGLRTAVIGGLTVVVSVFLLGYAPYARNLKTKGALLYPVMGKHKAKFNLMLEEMRPTNIVGKDRFSSFLFMHFSRTESGMGKPSRLKFPLSVFRSEAKAFKDTQIRSGGFGPFFGALLISMTFVVIMFAFRRTLRGRFQPFFVLSAILLITIFAHDQSWWARYAPQAWLLPLLWATAALLSDVRWLRWMGRSILALALANVIFVTGSFVHKQRYYTMETKRCLESMASATPPVYVDLSLFKALRQRLKEAGIHFILIKEQTPDNGFQKRHRIPGYEPMYWYERPAVRQQSIWLLKHMGLPQSHS